MRNKLKFGDSANDKTGDLLREGAFNIEYALSEIYLFLSGGVSEVKLPNALPVERGGSGASTNNSFTDAVVRYVSPRMGLSSTIGVPQAIVTLTSVGASTELFPGTMDIKSLRFTETVFSITDVGTSVIDETSVAIPKDINGNPLVALNVVYTAETKSYAINTYEVSYVDGRVVPNLNVPKPIPIGTCVRLLLVRRIAP